MTIAYLADGTLVDLKASKVVSITVARAMKHAHVYRYAIVRCGWCMMGRAPKHVVENPPKMIRARIHLQSKTRRLQCPICKRLTAYAVKLSIVPIEDSETVAAIKTIP